MVLQTNQTNQTNNQYEDINLDTQTLYDYLTTQYNPTKSMEQLKVVPKMVEDLPSHFPTQETDQDLQLNDSNKLFKNETNYIVWFGIVVLILIAIYILFNSKYVSMSKHKLSYNNIGIETLSDIRTPDVASEFRAIFAK